MPICKEIKLIFLHCLILSHQINSRWVKNINIKASLLNKFMILYTQLKLDRVINEQRSQLLQE